MSGARVWLLDLTVAGSVHRFATTPCAVFDADNAPYAYRGGLDPITLTTSGDWPRLTFRIGHESGVDWSQYAERGVDLAGASAVLRYWTEGDDLEEAVTWASGPISSVEYGDRYEPLTASIETAPWAVSSATIPPEIARIDALSTAGAANSFASPSALGASYPVIIGKPGGSASTSTGFPSTVPAAPATTALYSDTAAGIRNTLTRVICSGGYDVAASSVTVVDGETGRSESLAIVRGTDSQNTPFHYVNFAAATAIRPSNGGSLWIDWGSSSGGVYNRARTACLRGLGDVIWWLLEQGGMTVDIGRMSAAAGRLNRYNIDAAITSPAQPEALIRSQFAAFGLVRRQSADGLWYEELADSDPGQIDVPRLVVGAPTGANRGDRYPGQVGALSVARLGPVSIGAVEDVRNEIAIEFAPAFGAAFQRRITITGRQAWSATLGDRFDLACSVSRTRYGARPLTVQLSTVHEQATAELVGRALARRLATPRRRLQLEGGPELADALEPNQRVRVTDSSVRMSALPGRIVSMQIGLAGVVLDVELIDDVTARTRATT